MFILAKSVILFESWLNFPLAKLVMLLLMLGFFAGIIYYTTRAKREEKLYIRPIAGLAAMNEAIGRATEMGRPVLYVPGIADVDDIQTIASMVILAEVSKLAASYDTRTIVPTRMPLVFPLAGLALFWVVSALSSGRSWHRPQASSPPN